MLGPFREIRQVVGLRTTGMCDIRARPLLIGLSGCSPFRNYYGDPRRVAVSTELNCDRLNRHSQPSTAICLTDSDPIPTGLQPHSMGLGKISLAIWSGN